jgi:protein-tyrosine phosphatase
MVDIHCHILPSLDDGARDDTVALEMAQMALADGITHIVATPHSNSEFQFEPELNLRKRDQLQAKIGGGLTILLGCDFRLSYENLEDVRLRPQRYTINGLQYLLVEFADTSIPPSIDQIFSDLLSRKLVPIITHPERNPILSRNLDLLQKWVEQGCLVQVTANSFTGRFGKHAAKVSKALLEHNMLHFIATDAHDTSSRPPLLADARRIIAEERGEDAAAAVSEHNPRAVIEGREVPWRPEVRKLPERKWYSLHK